MAEKIKIRPAGIADLSVISALYRVLMSEMSALQPEIWRPREMSRSFICEMMMGERSKILLAEDEQRHIVGFAVVQDRDTLPLGNTKKRFCLLLDIVVAPARRGEGIGSALISASERWAVERGLGWIELNVLEENKDAYRLYESLGMTPAQHTMRKMLNASAHPPM